MKGGKEKRTIYSIIHLFEVLEQAKLLDTMRSQDGSCPWTSGVTAARRGFSGAGNVFFRGPGPQGVFSWGKSTELYLYAL